MYQENKSTTNLFKLGLCVIIAILVVLLSVKLVTIIVDKNKTNNTNKYMTTELEKLNDFAKKYYVGDLLPKKSGDSAKTSLKTLVDNKQLEEIKNKNGEACNLDESYISVIRLDKEYQFKSYLVCGKETNYLNSFTTIKIEEQTTKPVEKTTSKTVVKTTTTKKVVTAATTTTTKKQGIVEVSYNVNGGRILDSTFVKSGEKVQEIIPVRPGYKFIGWYYHGEKFDFTQPITHDTVLTAKWSLN